MTRVALVACDHGLGHVRRMVLVAEALDASGADVTLLAPPDAVARVRRALDLGGDGPAVVVPFATCTTPAALRAGDRAATCWEERLPDLSGYDRVVVDTLPELLAVRPDAVLVAQFLWHDVLAEVDPAYRARARALAETAGTVAGSLPFAMPAVRRLPGFVAVGLFADRSAPAPAGPPSEPGDLLISGGTTPAVVEPLRRVVAALAAAGPGRYRVVHVDHALLPPRSPDWMVAATHGPHLYDRLAAALVRPGLGVLTELLVRDVPAWMTYEAGNAELAHNARSVVSLGRGVDLGAIATPDEDPGWATATAGTLLEGPPRLAPAIVAQVPGPPPVRPRGADDVAALVLG